MSWTPNRLARIHPPAARCTACGIPSRDLTPVRDHALCPKCLSWHQIGTEVERTRFTLDELERGR